MNGGVESSSTFVGTELVRYLLRRCVSSVHNTHATRLADLNNKVAAQWLRATAMSLSSSTFAESNGHHPEN